MSSPQQGVYVMQDLPDRYIKIRVLHDYIESRKDEFGVHWQLRVG